VHCLLRESDFEVLISIKRERLKRSQAQREARALSSKKFHQHLCRLSHSNSLAHACPKRQPHLLLRRIERRYRAPYQPPHQGRLVRLQAARELAQYLAPTLKAIEHSGQLEMLQRLQALDTCTDAELEELLRQAEDLTRRRP